MTRTIALLGVLLCAALGCAAPQHAQLEHAPESAESRVLAQLRGHLPRARACLGEEGSGLFQTEFTIGTDGRVRNVEVTRNTSGNAHATRCLEQKIAALYFRPAPPAPMTRRETLVFCEEGSGSVCRLGPVHRPDGTRADGRLAAGVRDLEARVLACKADRAPDARGVVSVELTIGADGRVASGWVRHASNTELRSCSVAPVLGARVADELQETQRVRFTLGLRASAPPRTAQSAPTSL